METVIGTCGNCSGEVVVYGMSVDRTPHCKRCGARPKNPHGPVIPMEPRPIPTDSGRLNPIEINWPGLKPRNG